MLEYDAYKFQNEIAKFKGMIAPQEKQKAYLASTRETIIANIEAEAKKTGQPIERVLLVAFCGELTKSSNQKQQAEFATRLLLLDILTE